jgi:site-specific DNA-methyltransferase (adenine-specific)
LSARVVLGDALDVLRSLPAASVDAVVTDPPYGETACTWDMRLFGWPAEVLRVLKPHGSLWVFGSLRSHMETVQRNEYGGWKLAQDVVWEKHNGSGFDSDRFKRVHEIAVHWYPAARPWAEIHKEPQKVAGEKRPTAAIKARAGVVHRGAIGPHEYEYTDQRLARSVIYARSMHGRAEHETQKPEAILEPLIAYSCPPGGVVLDPFCGSGSTGIAAQRLGRSSILVDNRAECVALATRRLSDDAPLLTRSAS